MSTERKKKKTTRTLIEGRKQQIQQRRNEKKNTNKVQNPLNQNWIQRVETKDREHWVGYLPRNHLKWQQHKYMNAIFLQLEIPLELDTFSYVKCVFCALDLHITKTHFYNCFFSLYLFPAHTNPNFFFLLIFWHICICSGKFNLEASALSSSSSTASQKFCADKVDKRIGKKARNHATPIFTSFWCIITPKTILELHSGT